MPSIAATRRRRSIYENQDRLGGPFEVAPPGELEISHGDFLELVEGTGRHELEIAEADGLVIDQVLTASKDNGIERTSIELKSHPTQSTAWEVVDAYQGSAAVPPDRLLTLFRGVCLVDTPVRPEFADDLPLLPSLPDPLSSSALRAREGPNDQGHSSDRAQNQGPGDDPDLHDFGLCLSGNSIGDQCFDSR